MYKIGIITLNGYYNYGNRLQNYALQKALTNDGYSVQTIIHEEYLSDTLNDTRKSNKLSKFKRISIEKIGKKVRYFFHKKKFNEMRQQRIKNFKEFSSKYIDETNYSINSNQDLKQINDSFDFFIAGSDQIWNPLYQKSNNLKQSIEYLMFASPHKRLSYAASFGVNQIPTEYEEAVRSNLNGMASILVREDAGASIVKKLTDRDVNVVLDPTMLLTKEEWMNIASPHKNKPNKKYILTYFLGEKNSALKEDLTRLSKQNELTIVNLEDYSAIDFYSADPSNFIDFINDAEIFLTDSFHGVVFSILLQTPFVVYQRESQGPSMYSRIETLLNKFQLENRQNSIISNNNYFNISFEHANSILLEERRISLEFLRKSIT